MTTLMFTGYDAGYKELSDITVPRMAQYAERNGFDFTVHDAPLIDVPEGIYWTGVCGALKALRDENYDRVLYLDVDQLVTDPNYKLWFTYGFHASRDWGRDAVEPWQFSMCGFVATKNCIGLLTEVLNLEPAYRGTPFPEQAPFQAVVKRKLEQTPCITKGRSKGVDPMVGFINIHSSSLFNNVPDEVSPGNVVNPWSPGDFTAHLTMLPVPERIGLAKKILATLPKQ